MLRSLFFFFLAVLVFCSMPQPAGAQGRKWRTASAIGALSDQKFVWMELRDTAALARILHPSLRYIHSNGWVERRADVLQHLADSTLVYHGIKLDSTTITLAGRHTAVVTGGGVFDVSLRRAVVDSGGWVRGQYALLYTEVWARTGRRWVLMQRHACKAP